MQTCALLDNTKLWQNTIQLFGFHRVIPPFLLQARALFVFLQAPSIALHGALSWNEEGPNRSKEVGFRRPKSVKNQEKPRVCKIRVRNSGAGNGCANFMDAWKNALFLQEKPMSIKFRVLGGGVFWVFGGGGGGSGDFIFMGAGIFLKKKAQRWARLRCCFAPPSVRKFRGLEPPVLWPSSLLPLLLLTQTLDFLRRPSYWYLSF